jgi:hypothetical protein
MAERGELVLVMEGKIYEGSRDVKQKEPDKLTVLT